MPNDPFSAAERRHLAEDPPDWGFCDVFGCPNVAEPESPLCAKHEDDDYDREGDHG